MSEKFRPLLIRLPPDLDAELRRVATRNERPLSWIIRKALYLYLVHFDGDQERRAADRKARA